ncbi:MAG: site-specific tyrosine recombinase XerD [Dehalococcoidia bacterium]|nr:site-specific tyrosine recombinase XerD [Dehalococcoidia bacterium]
MTGCILRRPLIGYVKSTVTEGGSAFVVEQRIEAFLHYMSAERGASKNTIDAYRNDLTRFDDFATQRRGTGVAFEAKDIERDLVTDYILWLKQQTYAPATVARKVAAVKSFCAFLLDHGDLTSNPTAAIDSPRAPKPVPRPMTTADVDALLREPQRFDTAEAIRDGAMLELMYATGMRVTELVSLNVDSMHFLPRPAFVRCLGKGAKERTIPVYEQAVAAVERYFDEARPQLLKDRPQVALFVNRRGERLTRQGFWLILKGYAKSAGIEAHVTPHTLRHSFATHMLRGGASIRDVQELLGHANVSTTQVYTQLADAHLREVYEQVHPRAH